MGASTCAPRFPGLPLQAPPAGPTGLVQAGCFHSSEPSFLTAWTRLLSGGSPSGLVALFLPDSSPDISRRSCMHPSYFGDLRAGPQSPWPLTLAATMSSFSPPVHSMSRGHGAWNSGSEQLLISPEAAKQVNTELIPCTWRGSVHLRRNKPTRGL